MERRINMRSATSCVVTVTSQPTAQSSSSFWGLCPHAPGPLQCSGRLPAEPYPPQRRLQLINGIRLKQQATGNYRDGLGYMKGYHASVMGNPPPANPQRYLSHPPLETLIIAFGMLFFGGTERSQIFAPIRVSFEGLTRRPRDQEQDRSVNNMTDEGRPTIDAATTLI
ncbi:MAG: hypothetical protein JSW66_17105 [Phycisphaerales bacterium]|nr:MAG: hypothetical protein JSW66_17105 [Phycisphaerales bacterium]